MTSERETGIEVGEYPSGLRLSAAQDRMLRRWPLARIRPKSVALGVRSLLAEVDALRTQLAASEAARARLVEERDTARRWAVRLEQLFRAETTAAFQLLLDERRWWRIDAAGQGGAGEPG